MDYGLAFTFIPNSSKEWISKALMGVVFAVLIIFFGIGLIPLMGWSIAIARGVIQGREDPLPDWSELGQTIIDGLKLVVIFILWFIPLWILLLLGALINSDFLSIVLNCCGAIYGVLASILLLGVFGLLADDRPFGEALNPANSWRVVSANWANTILAWLVAALGASIASSLSIILCGVGIFLGIAYGYSLYGHLYGQLYREAQGSGKVAVA